MAVVLLKRRDSRNFLPLHQLSSNFSQEKHLVVTPLPSLKSFYIAETLNSFTQRKIHPLSATLPSHLFLARAQRIFKARSGLDTPANQFQFPLGDHEKALPYVYFGNGCCCYVLYQLWRLCPDTLCIWLAIHSTRLYYQNWGQARKFNPISLPQNSHSS